MTDKMISDPKMVSTILDQLCLHQTSVLIAQENNLIWGVIKDVNVFSKRVAIRPKNESYGFVIDPNLPVQIRSENDNLFFETKVTNFLKRNLSVFRFPKDILIESARQGSRFYFDTTGHQVYCNNFTLVDYSMESLHWKATLADISESGIALISNDPIIEQFNREDTIIFTFIDTYAVPKKLTGKIVYIKKFDSNEYKIGIQFEYIIPIYDVLEHLKGNHD